MNFFRKSYSPKNYSKSARGMYSKLVRTKSTKNVPSIGEERFWPENAKRRFSGSQKSAPVHILLFRVKKFIKIYFYKIFYMFAVNLSHTGHKFTLRQTFYDNYLKSLLNSEELFPARCSAPIDKLTRSHLSLQKMQRA